MSIIDLQKFLGYCNAHGQQRMFRVASWLKVGPGYNKNQHEGPQISCRIENPGFKLFSPTKSKIHDTLHVFGAQLRPATLNPAQPFGRGRVNFGGPG